MSRWLLVLGILVVVAAATVVVVQTYGPGPIPGITGSPGGAPAAAADATRPKDSAAAPTGVVIGIPAATLPSAITLTTARRRPQTRPRFTASIAAAVRDETPSLVRMLLTCRCTVRSLRCSRTAISALV